MQHLIKIPTLYAAKTPLANIFRVSPAGLKTFLSTSYVINHDSFVWFQKFLKLYVL